MGMVESHYRRLKSTWFPLYERGFQRYSLGFVVVRCSRTRSSPLRWAIRRGRRAGRANTKSPGEGDSEHRWRPARHAPSPVRPSDHVVGFGQGCQQWSSSHATTGCSSGSDCHCPGTRLSKTSNLRLVRGWEAETAVKASRWLLNVITRSGRGL